MAESAKFSTLSWATIVAQKAGKTPRKPYPKQRKVVPALPLLKHIVGTSQWHAAAPERAVQHRKNVAQKLLQRMRSLATFKILIRRMVRRKELKGREVTRPSPEQILDAYWRSRYSQPMDKSPWIPKDDETFIDDIDGLRDFLPNLINLKPGNPDWFCDMEGDSLAKAPGTASLLQMTSKSLNHTWIFDLTKLGKKVFYFMGTRGQSIGQLLESDRYATAWWDLRNDQNALWFHFHVRLSKKATIDLSYLELATRMACHGYRLGLRNAVAQEAHDSGYLTWEELATWSRNNREGRTFFKTNPLGYGVFDVLPRPEIVMEYAAGDTKYMPMLFGVYMKRMRSCEFSMELLREKLAESLDEVCTDSYDPNGSHACAPAFFGGPDPYDDYF